MFHRHAYSRQQEIQDRLVLQIVGVVYKLGLDNSQHVAAALAEILNCLSISLLGVNKSTNHRDPQKLGDI